MRAEMSLAEMLMNAIAGGQVWRVQFKRRHGYSSSDEQHTFEDLNKVIAKRLDSALEVARENGYQETFRSRAEAELRGELKGLEYALARVPGMYADAIRARIAELKKSG